MTIIVKRFRLRHNGKVYGPGQPGGQIVEGLSEEEEARLISGSNGSIEKYVPPKAAKVEDGSEKENKKDEKVVKEENSEEEKLIDVDPGELIKPGKKKKGK